MTENREAFLSALAETANVSESCKRVGIGRMTVYRWREDDPLFAAEWDVAVKLGTAALEGEAIRRAREGVDEPVFYKGEHCGNVRRYSDTLLIFTLKARKPDVYRERASIEHTGANGGPLEHAVQFYLPTNGCGDQPE